MQNNAVIFEAICRLYSGGLAEEVIIIEFWSRNNIDDYIIKEHETLSVAIRRAVHRSKLFLLALEEQCGSSATTQVICKQSN